MKKRLFSIVGVVAISGMLVYGGEQGTTLTFSNAPLDAVVETYRGLTEKTMVVHPTVPKILFTFSAQGLAKEDALLAVETLLYLNAIGLVAKDENLILVCPITAAGHFVPHLITEMKDLPNRDYVVRYKLPVANLDAKEMTQVLFNFTAGGPCQVTPVPAAKAVVITAPASAVRCLAEIARNIDVPQDMPKKLVEEGVLPPLDKKQQKAQPEPAR